MDDRIYCGTYDVSNLKNEKRSFADAQDDKVRVQDDKVRVQDDKVRVQNDKVRVQDDKFDVILSEAKNL